MQEPNRNKEEKREGREIRFGAPGHAEEKPRGRFYLWLDNFWYHYKWHTIVSLFFIIVITVCTLQMCSKEEEGDLSIVMAGPFGFATQESNYNAVSACLSNYLAADYNENGEKKVQIISYTVYSTEQIKALSDTVMIDTAANSRNYQSFFQHLTLGESAVLFVDPWLYEELLAQSGYLMELQETLGFCPQGGITSTDPQGKSGVYGVRLEDTPLYQGNSAIRNSSIPKDTVVCLLAPFAMGKNSKPEEYQKSVDYFKALMQEK